jgi:hypothetical protein
MPVSVPMRARSRSPRLNNDLPPECGDWKLLKSGNWKFTFRCPTLAEVSAFDAGVASWYHGLNWQVMSRRTFADGAVKEGTTAGKLAVRFKETEQQICRNTVYVTARRSRIEILRIQFEQNDTIGIWRTCPETDIPPLRKPNNILTIRKPTLATISSTPVAATVAATVAPVSAIISSSA